MEDIKRFVEDFRCPFCGVVPTFLFSKNPEGFLTIACENGKCKVNPIAGPHSPFEVTLSAWSGRYYPKEIMKVLRAYQRMDKFFGEMSNYKFCTKDATYLCREMEILITDLKKL